MGKIALIIFFMGIFAFLWRPSIAQIDPTNPPVPLVTKPVPSQKPSPVPVASISPQPTAVATPQPTEPVITPGPGFITPTADPSPAITIIQGNADPSPSPAITSFPSPTPAPSVTPRQSGFINSIARQTFDRLINPPLSLLFGPVEADYYHDSLLSPLQSTILLLISLILTSYGIGILYQDIILSLQRYLPWKRHIYSRQHSPVTLT